MMRGRHKALCIVETSRLPAVDNARGGLGRQNKVVNDVTRCRALSTKLVTVHPILCVSGRARSEIHPKLCAHYSDWDRLSLWGHRFRRWRSCRGSRRQGRLATPQVSPLAQMFERSFERPRTTQRPQHAEIPLTPQAVERPDSDPCASANSDPDHHDESHEWPRERSKMRQAVPNGSGHRPASCTASFADGRRHQLREF